MSRQRLWLVCGFSVGVAIAGVVGAERSSATMTAAASRWLTSLSPEQCEKAVFALASDERSRWHYIPATMFPRKGLPFKDMTEAQRGFAHDLLKAGLSQRGYLTTTTIIDLENILRATEKNPAMRDPELYFLSIFGTPAPKAPWGWRIDGHHVSLHFTVINDTLAVALPTFFGSNPAEVRTGPKAGTRALGPLEDAARTLVTSLDAARRAKAVMSAVAPDDILSTNLAKADPLSPAGLMSAEMNEKERKLLMELIESYTSLMAADIAAGRLDRLRKAGLDKIGFVWAGDAERGKKHYYRVQGPTFLIEYDNTQNEGNHVHSVWRDFNGDFGRDLLREHVRLGH